ncbi:MAG: CDP-glycerol glycerophosphotransferase family protein, partial [Actinomycetota bacterium]|nr:CDP-glycerol glycerophosphotransferase family protein [Actinomycetota bacterium]
MQLYIDPGTGSMLFTVLIGLLSAGVYAFRSFFIKLRFAFSGGHQEKAADACDEYVIFTDDKRYWNVFGPICDEFEARGIGLSYFTASPDDPALKRSYDHVHCAFIGEGNRAFAKLNMLKADIVLSSTPGLDVYQWKRSRDVKWYAHILHAISDATMYRMFGIDFYDAVLLAGEYQADQIRALEEVRGLPPKELPIVGLSYMDKMAARYQETGPCEDGVTTVLLAPSWGASAIFSLYGGDIIDALLETGYHVVIRPHPQSLTSEKDMIDRLRTDYPNSDQLEWNFDNDNFEVLRRSDILISDFSGVIFDFTLVFDRPVIYTEPSFDKAPYDACWLPEELWTFDTLPRIGRVLDMDKLGSMKALIDDCLDNPVFQAGRDRTRAECWGCRGESVKATVDYLVAKHDELVGG